MINAKKREVWLRHLESWKSSGLSASRYCIENGINKNSFRYWIDRDKGKIKTKKSLVKLNIPQQLPVSESNNISLKYGSYELSIPTGFDKAGLNRILDVLQERAL